MLKLGEKCSKASLTRFVVTPVTHQYVNWQQQTKWFPNQNYLLFHVVWSDFTSDQPFVEIFGPELEKRSILQKKF